MHTSNLKKAPDRRKLLRVLLRLLEIGRAREAFLSLFVDIFLHGGHPGLSCLKPRLPRIGEVTVVQLLNNPGVAISQVTLGRGSSIALHPPEGTVDLGSKQDHGVGEENS